MTRFVSFFVALQILLVLVGAVNIDTPISTGQGLTYLTVDPNWNVACPDGSSSAAYVGGYTTHSTFANFVTPKLQASGNASSGNYVFTTQFDLVKYDPANYYLAADVSSDDQVVAISINGNAVALNTPCNAGAPSTCTISYKFGGVFQSGVNTLSFTVNNIPATYVNPVGLYVNFEI